MAETARRRSWLSPCRQEPAGELGEGGNTAVQAADRGVEAAADLAVARGGGLMEGVELLPARFARPGERRGDLAAHEARGPGGEIGRAAEERRGEDGQKEARGDRV